MESGAYTSFLHYHNGGVDMTVTHKETGIEVKGFAESKDTKALEGMLLAQLKGKVKHAMSNMRESE